MSFPSHLILDFNSNSNKKILIPYWALNFSSSKTNNPVFIDEINVNCLVSRTNVYSWLQFLKLSSTTFFETRNNTNLTALSSNLGSNTSNSSTYPTENLININFIRYERLYTKLKYSRSPAFDIVSGGAAALLAGFVGFLISEKFGFELVDSGDFYYLFMYVVFGTFLLKPLLYISDVNNSIIATLSITHFINFFKKLLLLLLLNLKKVL